LYFGRFMLLKVLFYTQSQKRCPLYTLRYVSVYLMVILLAIPLLLIIVVMCFFVGNTVIVTMEKYGVKMRPNLVGIRQLLNKKKSAHKFENSQYPRLINI